MEQNLADLTELFRRRLVRTVIIRPVVAALLLLVAYAFVSSYAVLNPAEPTHVSVIHPLNDVLRALIMLELIWMAGRFPKNRIPSLRRSMLSVLFLRSGVSSW
jgi:hypothetical protein